MPILHFASGYGRTAGGIEGKKVVTLRGATVAADFKQMVVDYIGRRMGGRLHDVNDVQCT
jgi:hypothetical protein